MSRSASFTTNAWFPSMPTLDAPLRVFSNCVLWLQPRNWRDPGASYSRVLVAVDPLYHALRMALADAGRRAACSCPVKPHQLRHTFATEMIRLGVSLPAVMQLLGHKDIRMTLRYVEVTQRDLQREFHTARLNLTQSHRLPVPSVPDRSATADLPGIRQALNAARHLLEMYRRQLSKATTQRTLGRLDKRLLAVATELDQLANAEK
jgi:hypothetical protein